MLPFIALTLTLTPFTISFLFPFRLIFGKDAREGKGKDDKLEVVLECVCIAILFTILDIVEDGNCDGI